MLYGDALHDDTAAIQELLDKRGAVSIDRPGTYIVSKTLIIHSNTRFTLCPGAIIRVAPRSLCAVIENEHFAGGGRDEGISIVGGTFDGNCDEMGLDGEYEAIHRLDHPYSPELFKGKLMRFAHVDGISLEKLTVKDPVSYGVQIADSRGFLVRDVRFDYNHHFGTTDGIHINGPARDGVIENLWGTTNDDMVSLTTVDEPHAEVTLGPISNVYIHNVCAENGYSGVRLLAAGDFPMTDVRIDGVYGDYRHNAVLISQHGTRPNTKVWFDGIVIENVHASKSERPLGDDCFTYWEKEAYRAPVIWLEKGINVGYVSIRNVIRRERSKVTKAYLLKLDEGAVIDRLVVENVYQTNAEGVDAPVIFNKATVGSLVMRDVCECATPERVI